MRSWSLLNYIWTVHKWIPYLFFKKIYTVPGWVLGHGLSLFRRYDISWKNICTAPGWVQHLPDLRQFLDEFLISFLKKRSAQFLGKFLVYPEEDTQCILLGSVLGLLTDIFWKWSEQFLDEFLLSFWRCFAQFLMSSGWVQYLEFEQVSGCVPDLLWRISTEFSDEFLISLLKICTVGDLTWKKPKQNICTVPGYVSDMIWRRFAQFPDEFLMSFLNICTVSGWIAEHFWKISVLFHPAWVISLFYEGHHNFWMS